MKGHAEQRIGPIIEFIGLPGTGKTSVAVELARILHSSRSPIHGPLGGEPFGENANRRAFLAYHLARLSRVARMAALDPGFSVESWKALASTGQPSTGGLLRLGINWLSKADLTRSVIRRSGIVVLDEGILHAAWSANYSATDGRYLPPSIISSAYKVSRDRGWVVIDVDGSADLALARVERRHGLRHRMVRHIPEIGRDRVVERAEKALDAVRAALGGWAGEGHPVTVLRTRSQDRSPRVAAESLAEELSSLTEADASGPAGQWTPPT